MSGLVAKLIWFFTNADAHEIAAPLVVPFAIAFGLYQSHYPYALLRGLWVRTFGDGFRPFSAADAPSIGMVIPTLLRNAGDRAAIEKSLVSIATTRYRGALTVVLAIDGLDGAPAEVETLRGFAARLALPANVRFELTGSATRHGKAMAGDVGVRHLEALVHRGELAAMPRVFFNMDADCEMDPYALDRMVRALVRPSRLTGQPGTLVTSHVAIREEDYWRGWRALFTGPGLIAITVAREYLVAIGLGRHNVLRVLPQNGASGALYCTWMEVAVAAPAWGRFLLELRWRDWARWWLGAAPPAFAPSTIEPLPEAMTGMGDDTWMSWLACAARFEDGRVTVALPRTPAHAAWYALVAFFARPFRYDPLAKVYTTTPTSLRALFRQRARWNVSRIWTVQRWRLGLFYHLSIGIPALLDVVISTAFQGMIVAGLLLAPFAGPTPAMAPALFVLVELAYGVERVVATTIAMIGDPDERGQLRKLLGLPLAGVFHFVFNVASTISGFLQQVFGRGFDDGFAPEHTLIRGGTGRIALSYRVRRFYALAWRSVVHGDVPIGWFWLGWGETPWTPDGYEGWTTGRAVPLVRVAAETAEAEIARAALPPPPPTTPPPAPETDPDESGSGIRARPSRIGDRTSSAA